MSGTSHDGLDLAHCSFSLEKGSWNFKINVAETIPYSDEWKQRLMALPEESNDNIKETDIELGRYIGRAVKDFIERHELSADLVASHGHTIFHDPAHKLTLQIGKGEEIASICRIKVINDFRSQDVELGGQGAPLVPIGDKMLFGDYDLCLNIGGIANISYEKDGQRLAYDICAVNMVLNKLASYSGKEYDDRGMMAAVGIVQEDMLEQLESLAYYHMTGPRSLGREWVEENIFPLLHDADETGINNLLATYTEHAAQRIAAVIDAGKRVLVTGGGAYNDQLLKRIQTHCDAEIIVPDKLLVEFKEAMIFAFLGVLRDRGDNNVLGSVTGSGVDHSSGQIHIP